MPLHHVSYSSIVLYPLPSYVWYSLTTKQQHLRFHTPLRELKEQIRIFNYFFSYGRVTSNNTETKCFLTVIQAFITLWRAWELLDDYKVMPFLTLTITFAALQFAESIQNQKYFLLLKFTVYLTIYCFSLELYELSPSSFFRSSGVICKKDEVILILHLIQHSVIFEVWGFFLQNFYKMGF